MSKSLPFFYFSRPSFVFFYLLSPSAPTFVSFLLLLVSRPSLQQRLCSLKRAPSLQGKVSKSIRVSPCYPSSLPRPALLTRPSKRRKTSTNKDYSQPRAVLHHPDGQHQSSWLPIRSLQGRLYHSLPRLATTFNITFHFRTRTTTSISTLIRICSVD